MGQAGGAGLFNKQHKYRAQRTYCANGHWHPSKAEAKRCDELKILENAGAISGLEHQPTYYFQVNGETVKHPNGRRVSYTPDWRYVESGQTIVEECKGFRTADYVLRLAFFRAFYPYLEHRETGR
jgi:hypothetical protein